MKIKHVLSGLGVVLLMAGCASTSYQQAVVADGSIQNSALGFSGFSVKIPAGYTLYQPDDENPQEWNELQRMAIRIYDTNREYHPCGNELFYESFLLMSDKSCFLLVTLKSSDSKRFDSPVFSDELASQADLLPLYNVTETHSMALSNSRFPAVYSMGSAYEKSGWYFAKSKKNSQKFSYEACKMDGGNRDRYILMGLALPDQAGTIAAPMKQMMSGMKF